MSASNDVPAKNESAKAAAAAVIRQLNGSEETSQERLMKKQLPAWVISGAIHVAFISIAIMIFALKPTDAKQSEKVITTSVEKAPEEEQEKNLTNEDPGLDSNLTAAVDVEKVAEQTVDAKVTEDPIGSTNPDNINQATQAAPGMVSELTNPGFAGDTGAMLAGGGGTNGFMLSSGLSGRSGATKERLLKSGGGSEASELAVARGLAWLARKQLGDKNSKIGWWQYDTDGAHKNDIVPATGMSLLPFLAAGETHKSGKKYQTVVARGIEFLKLQMDNGKNGGFINPDKKAPNMYGQAIGCMALIECFGMTKDPLLRSYAQKAVNFIQSSQGANGSWGYAPAANGDTSIVGWQIQALHSAKLTKDLAVSDAVIKKANRFLDEVSGGSNKATYGYASGPGNPGTSLTAVGLLCRYYENGWGPNNPGMIEGVKGMLARPPRKGFYDMYYYYYATQVVHFFEGKSWKTWNEGDTPGTGMRDMLIGMQVLKNDPDLMGSWDADQAMIGRQCGRLGTTAMAMLTLEVYYRHLPLYKRANAEGGLKELDRAAGN